MGKMTLPKGWAKADISQVISKTGLIVDGDWVESKDQDINGLVRLIQLADIGDGEFRNRSSRFMNKEATERLNCTFLQAGDVLVARMPDPLGRACIFPQINQDSVTVVDVCLIRVDDFSAIGNKLLMYLINSYNFRNIVSENASGTTRKRITRKKLEKISFNLPPLAEQKEIVCIIESHLQLVDQIKSRLDALPKILEQFRQSVLASAVSGKLTERKNNSTRELLVNLTTKIGSGSTPRGGEKNYKIEGIPLIRSMNIHFNEIKYDGLAYIDDMQAEALKNVTVYEDDVLLNITGASIGRVTTAPKELNNARVNQHVSIIRTDNKKLLPKYLEFYLSSPIIQHWIESENYGATRQALTKTMIENLEIVLPSLEEQKEIVKRVESLFTFADQIESKIKNAQERVNLLTQSILAKAFRGEFTAKWREDNPDLISGENSAEALLKQIEEAKKAAKKKK